MTDAQQRRQQFYRDVLAAIPDAVGSWARTRAVSDTDGSLRIVVTDMADGVEGQTHTIGVDDIANYWQELIKVERAGGFAHCDDRVSVGKADLSMERGDGGEDFDLHVVDALVQLAVCGDIPYNGLAPSPTHAARLGNSKLGELSATRPAPDVQMTSDAVGPSAAADAAL